MNTNEKEATNATSTANIELMNVLAACMYCLDAVMQYMRAEDHGNILRAGLLRLRLSRIAAANIYPNTLTDEEIKLSSKELSELLSLLHAGNKRGDDSQGSQELAERVLFDVQDETLQEVLEKMDQIATKRSLIEGKVPVPPGEEHYQGCINWTNDEYDKAAGCMESLEETLGRSNLGDWSREEQKEMLSWRKLYDDDQDKYTFYVADREWGSALEAAAKQLDPWTADWISKVKGLEQDSHRRRLIALNIGNYGGASFARIIDESQNGKKRPRAPWLIFGGLRSKKDKS